MEDSFKVRVDKVFSSLTSAASAVPLTTSLWCLSDEELRKHPWPREIESLADDDDDDDEDPFPIDVDRFLSSAGVKLGPDRDNQNPNPNPSTSTSTSNSTRTSSSSFLWPEKGELGQDGDDRNPNPNGEDSRREMEDDLRELDEDSGEGTSAGGHRPNPNPNPSLRPSTEDLSREMEDDLQELDDDDDDDDAGEGTSASYAGERTSVGGSRRSPIEVGEEEERDELDVRSAIGMDSTLDFEEEEDEYDKVAVGREATGDRLYMNDVTDYIPHLAVKEIPDSFKEAPRDPRANHLAAKLRLKEDAEAARSFNSLHVSEPSVSDAQSNKEDAEAANISNSLHVSEHALAVVSDAENVNATQNNREDVETFVSEAQNKTQEDAMSLKSILKRKEDQISNSKSEKRVRFESSCKNDDERLSEGEQNVPDYIRNPSRYKHYTFDSLTDMNEESNRQAYMDFLSMIKKSKQSEPEEAPADLSKPVVFNPKKKAAQIREITMEEPMHKKSLSVNFASQNRSEDDEPTEMEVNDDDDKESVGMKVGSGKRAARQYRLKRIDECIESDS